MRLVSVVAAGMLFLATTVYAAAPPPAVIAIARQRTETMDARATGRMVRVDASGNQISDTFTIKAHWFPGVLRTLIEIVPPRTSAADAGKDARVSILLEMRPNGHNAIRIFHPRQSLPAPLPFNQWSESVLGSDFNYEDFLQPEYFWQSQMILKRARLGARDCDVVKSMPGVLDHSHYSEVQSWFDHTIGYPVFVEKTLKDGGVVKTFTSFGLSQSGGVWSARQVEVKTHGRPGSTILILERGSTRANLTINDFSPELIHEFEDQP